MRDEDEFGYVVNKRGRPQKWVWDGPPKNTTIVLSDKAKALIRDEYITIQAFIRDALRGLIYEGRDEPTSAEPRKSPSPEKP